MQLFFLIFSIILSLSLLITGLLYLLRRRVIKTDQAIEPLHPGPAVMGIVNNQFRFFPVEGA